MTMPDDADAAYSNEAPAGPTLEQLAGTGHGPPGGGNTPATGVASAPGGGAIDAALVGTDTEVLGAGSDGGVSGGGVNDLDVDAVTGTGAGAGTGELDTMETGTTQADDGSEGEDGFGGTTMDAAARNSTMPPVNSQPNPRK